MTRYNPDRILETKTGPSLLTGGPAVVKDLKHIINGMGRMDYWQHLQTRTTTFRLRINRIRKRNWVIRVTGRRDWEVRDEIFGGFPQPQQHSVHGCTLNVICPEIPVVGSVATTKN